MTQWKGLDRMIKRKTTGSIVCPSCGRLISANASECMHCGKKNPGLWGFAPEMKRLFGGFSDIISQITVACIFLYLLALLLQPAAIFQSRGIFDILGPDMRALDKLGMTGTYAVSQGRWWTILTAIYLHGSLLHILFNMLWIRQLGHMVVELFGQARTFIIFTIAGAAGFVISNLVGIPFTIGASGSIFGLLGALVYYGRKRGGYFGMTIYRQVGTWAIVLFLFGFFMSTVNNFAHAGGFIGGYLAAMLLGFQEMRLENSRHRMGALLCVLGTIAAFIVEIISNVF
jgi:rhomboid protease GluP